MNRIAYNNNHSYYGRKEYASSVLTGGRTECLISFGKEFLSGFYDRKGVIKLK